jgi:hypothetical protein
MHSIIVTVHGTFASKAKWPLQDSALSRRLNELIPGTVEFKPFVWCGRNSFVARQTTADTA